MRVQSERQERGFELIAGDPALDLVNTLDWRFRASGTEELLPSYGALVGFCEQSGVLTPKQARGLRRETSESAGEKGATLRARVTRGCRGVSLRGARRAQACGGDSRHAGALFQGRAEAAAIARRCIRLALGLAGRRDRRGAARRALALRTEALSTSDRLQALRECGDPGCRWLFLDTSKNHTRRWCDMKVCGNRMKARRFKALRSAD